MVNRSFRIASLMAVITYACIGSQAVQAQGFLNKVENAVQGGVDRVEFSQWANQHPEWVSSHHDRYEYFVHHPQEAEQSRSEWYEWKAERNAERNAEGVQFAEWANHHPEWVSSHHDRYEFFLHHPEDADRSRSEWYEWKADRNAERNAEQVQFAEWAGHHQEWVSSHHDRYEFFIHHPEDAQKYRSEWYEWHHSD